MIRSVLSTTGAALLLTTCVYAQEPPPLRAAVDGTFAPHAFPNLSGGYQGFNIDLANEIAKRLKRKITIDAAQFSGLVPALQAGTYEFLAAPTTVTKERADSKISRARPSRLTRGRPMTRGRVTWKARSAGRSSRSAPRPMRFRRCSSAAPTP